MFCKKIKKELEDTELKLNDLHTLLERQSIREEIKTAALVDIVEKCTTECKKGKHADQCRLCLSNIAKESLLKSEKIPKSIIRWETDSLYNPLEAVLQEKWGLTD
jgi:hypothetical protein